MSKYFYVITTGAAQPFDDGDDIADFPAFQDWNPNATAEETRAIRNDLIAKTDWWAVSDRVMTAEQTAYRQSLRDLPTHTNWPALRNDDWPVSPSV